MTGSSQLRGSVDYTLRAQTAEEFVAIRSYHDLDVWKKGLFLLGAVYRLADFMPTFERWGMVSQLRRAAVSVLTNIAEGNGRIHRAEYVHHLAIARGSVLEIEAIVHGARHLGFLTDAQSAECLRLVNDVGRMLTMLIRSMARGLPPQRPTADRRAPSPDDR